MTELDAADHSVGMSANAALGFTVAGVLFVRRTPHARLASAMEITPTRLGRMLHGQTIWSFEDLSKAANFLQVDLESLIPLQNDDGTWKPVDPLLLACPGHSPSDSTDSVT